MYTLVLELKFILLFCRSALSKFLYSKYLCPNMDSLITSDLLACNIACQVQRRNVRNIFPPLPSRLILILMEECQHFFTPLSFLPYRHIEIKKNKKVSSKVWRLLLYPQRPVFLPNTSCQRPIIIVEFISAL